ncbi:MAG: cutinase family protein [Actinomycetes bacterium]
MSLRRTVLAALGASLLLAASCTPLATRGQFAVPAGPCADATMVWARGSSMPVRSGEARAAQRRFLDGMAAAAPSLRAGTLELGDLDADGEVDEGGYPAVPGGLMAGLDLRADPTKDLPVIGGFNESVRLGADELAGVLATLHARCPEQVFVVAGISQGAEAVMRGLPLLPAELVDRVAAVHVFGDPGFVVGPWMVAPDTEIPSGHGLLGPRSPYVPAPLAARTTSWCAQFDGVCSGQFWFALLDAVKECPAYRELPACSRRHTDYDYWAFEPAMAAAARSVVSLRG